MLLHLICFRIKWWCR